MSKKEKKTKEPKRVPKYKFFACYKWLMALLWKFDKSIVFSAITVIPLAVILYGINLYLPSVILDSIETSKTFDTVVITIAVIVAVQLVFRIIKNYVDLQRELSRSNIDSYVYYLMGEKYFDLDYFVPLDKKHSETLERATNAGNNGVSSVVSSVSNMAVDIICFFVFGSMISLLSPWILLLLVGGSVINYLMTRMKQNYDYRTQPLRDKNQRRLRYIAYSIAGNREFAKDTRLYSFADYIAVTLESLFQRHRKLFNDRQKVQTVVSVTGFAITALRDGIAYAFLISRTVAGELSPAEFVLYFSAITMVSNFIGGIIGNISSLRDYALKTSDFREGLEVCGTLNRGKGAKIEEGTPFSIEFRNVTYKYPQGDRTVLENVSFVIKPGEKIALVGLNGAGKTTLTNIMCGLILPDEGEVLINGRSVLEYNRDELYSHISLVPQYHTVLPTTVAENIALCDRSNIDESKLNHAIALAGLEEKISKLSKGVDTPMAKMYDDDAVDFSGGETQRLLLARAIYRVASLLILDEPTAALDPIAEDEIYRKYNEIAVGATSVFISHRLASTRFCDRIYLLDGARFAECGTHDELIALGGKYANLFAVQSKYYKEEVCE